MNKKLLLSLGLIGCAATASFAQKATVKDSTVYRNGEPYCRMVRLSTSISSPRFAFKTLTGQEFALAQKKPGEGFVLYFTELDTLVPIAPAIPYANALAEMLVQYDMVAGGAAPDLKAVRRLARLEARGPQPVREAVRGIVKDVDDFLRDDNKPRRSPPPAVGTQGLMIAGNKIMRQGKVLGQYTAHRFFDSGEAYKTLVFTRPDGRRVAEADLLVSDAQSCRLRLPDTHKVVELPVPYFPEMEQVKQIAQYLLDHSYLE